MQRSVVTVKQSPGRDRSISVDRHQLFYREGGSDDSPVLLLLHGYAR